VHGAISKCPLLSACWMGAICWVETGRCCLLAALGLNARLLVVAKLHRWLDAAAGGSRSPSRGGSRWQVVTWREETHGRRQL
jgi:hypothetical protein